MRAGGVMKNRLLAAILIAPEALRGRSIRRSASAAQLKTDKLKNAILVAPDVDVDVFRTQILRMGPARPRIALFVSQDDSVLGLSKVIWGDVPRMGDIDPSQEPYRTELEREKITVFDLTKVGPGSDAHDRAFEEITPVMAMIAQRFKQGQSMNDRGPEIGNQIENAATGATTR
jgi:esterase/lipase superfamily enzyme